MTPLFQLFYISHFDICLSGIHRFHLDLKSLNFIESYLLLLLFYIYSYLIWKGILWKITLSFVRFSCTDMNAYVLSTFLHPTSLKIYTIPCYYIQLSIFCLHLLMIIMMHLLMIIIMSSKVMLNHVLTGSHLRTCFYLFFYRCVTAKKESIHWISFLPTGWESKRQ